MSDETICPICHKKDPDCDWEFDPDDEHKCIGCGFGVKNEFSEYCEVCEDAVQD